VILQVPAFGGEESINHEVRQGKETGTIRGLVIRTLQPPRRAPSPPAWRREVLGLGPRREPGEGTVQP